MIHQINVDSNAVIQPIRSTKITHQVGSNVLREAQYYSDFR